MKNLSPLFAGNLHNDLRAQVCRCKKPSSRKYGVLTIGPLLGAAALIAGSIAPASASEASSPTWSASPSTSTISETKSFRSGDAVLQGTLHLPKVANAIGAVVVTHTASKPLQDSLLYEHLKEMLPPLGIAVFSYDRRGSGKSSGNLKNSDYAMLADDAIAAVQLLKKDPRIDPKRVGIWGLSQGGWLSLLAATRSPDVRFAVSIAAPVVTPDVQMMFRSENLMQINGYPEAEIQQMRKARKAVDDYMRGLGTRSAAQALVDTIKDKPWFDMLYLGATVSDRATSRWRKEIEYDPLPTLDDVKVPALILYGESDPEVPVATSVARINARRHSNLTVRVVAGADHHMATTMEPKAQMDPAQTERAIPEASEYYAILASWLTAQGIASAN
jgi:pimeloyl-ACP methyl ester carboxylesterase